jgi:hypothetical protein
MHGPTDVCFLGVVATVPFSFLVVFYFLLYETEGRKVEDKHTYDNKHVSFPSTSQ